LRELRDFVTRKASDGWVLAQEYTDKVSGKTDKRPAFQQMFADASRKQFDMILFWSLDRFSREGVLETLQHLQKLTSYGVEWFSFREEYLRSVGVFRDAVLSILACIAKQERIRLSERVVAGLKRAKAQGKVLGRPKAAVRDERVLLLKRRQRDDSASHIGFPSVEYSVGVNVFNMGPWVNVQWRVAASSGTQLLPPFVGAVAPRQLRSPWVVHPPQDLARPHQVDPRSPA
jgi:hypothetical protein